MELFKYTPLQNFTLSHEIGWASFKFYYIQVYCVEVYICCEMEQDNFCFCLLVPKT